MKGGMGGRKGGVRGLAPETQRWLGTISIDTTVMMTPRSGVSVDGDEIDGVGDKVVIPDRSGLLPSVLSISGLLVCYEPPSDLICVASDTAPALSPESTFFVEYCTGGPSSTTPVLLSCVDSFDTAPPPQDLLAGFLYTAPSL
ncbi:uncharacterized protein UHOD_11050 [Ustilago sp. UG-2017b]|nr:uncharacterized protein UHOD_11050 [Ustilago sp. UG-2017b]